MSTALHNPARTWTDGVADLTAALANQEMRDQFDFLQNTPFVSVTRTGGPVSVLNNTNTILTWNSELEDTDGMHDNVTNNSRLSVPVAGIYRVHGCIYWASSAGAGTTVLTLLKNGAVTFEVGGHRMPADFRQELTWEVRLAATDFLELRVWQNAGVSRTYEAVGSESSLFQARWVRA